MLDSAGTTKKSNKIMKNVYIGIGCSEISSSKY
jgi:hypothetical protein